MRKRRCGAGVDRQNGLMGTRMGRTDGLRSDFMPKDDDVEPSEFNGNVVVGGGLKNEREGKKKTAHLAVSERQRIPQSTAVKQREFSKMLHLSN